MLSYCELTCPFLFYTSTCTCQ